MGTRLAGLGEKEKGATMSRPKNLGQEAYYRSGLKDIQ
jgi:hypothetical protein